MVASKVPDQKKETTISELPSSDTKTTSPPKPNPTEVKRKCTDVFWLYVFGVLFIGWFGLIVYVTSMRQMYRHHINANLAEPEEEIVEAEDNWLTLLKKGICAYFTELWQYLKEDWHIVLPTIGSIALGCVSITGLAIVLFKLLERCFPSFCFIEYFFISAFLAGRAVIIWGLINIFTGYPGTTINERVFCAEEIRYIDVMTSLLVALMFSFFTMLNTIPDSRYVDLKNKHPLFKDRIMLNVTLGIFSTVAITIAGVQFTGPTDPLRAVILIGGFYVVRFFINYGQMVVAMAQAAHHQLSQREIKKRQIRVFNYSGVVVRYHLGTVALSTLNIFSIPQSIWFTLRYAFVKPVRNGGNVISRLFQKIYLMFNAGDYGHILTAVNGTSHCESTKKATLLLSRYCSTSRSAIIKGLDTILCFGILAAIYVKIVKPISEFGFEYLPLPKTLHTNDLSIWILIGIFGSLACFFNFVTKYFLTTIRATRLCLLEDRVHNQALIGTNDDVSFAEDRLYRLLVAKKKKSTDGKELQTVATDKSKIEKLVVEDTKLEAVKSVAGDKIESSM